MEKASEKKTLHLNHSENILDLKAADPFITNTRQSLPARMAYNEPVTEQFNTTSIMKKDYGPFVSRSYVQIILVNIFKNMFYHSPYFSLILHIVIIKRTRK